MRGGPVRRSRCPSPVAVVSHRQDGSLTTHVVDGGGLLDEYVDPAKGQHSGKTEDQALMSRRHSRPAAPGPRPSGPGRADFHSGRMVPKAPGADEWRHLSPFVPVSAPPPLGVSKPVVARRDLAEAQLAGLSAAIRLSEAAAPTRSIPSIRPAYTSPGPSKRPRRQPSELGRTLTQGPWPLLTILIVQAAMSLRLIWSNTAFPDEALYLWAGHMEWSHWLTGAKIPQFQTYFSGAPAIYPPLGALADTYGGLAGARLLSLCFMLGATTLLHRVAKRLFDRRSALFAVGLFAGLAATQYLGAFATYDAMALFFLSLATWLGVRAIEAKTRSATLLLIASGIMLTVADATKYAAALFTLVVIAVVGMYAWRKRGFKAGIGVGMTIFWSFLLSLAGAIILGGHPYIRGIMYTTLTRTSSNSPAPFLLFVSAKWEGVVLLLAVIGTATVIFTDRRWGAKTLAIVLAVSAFLVPIEQARIHTYTSLFKHIGYGAWFATIVAGYALAALLNAVPKVKAANALRVSICTVVLAGLPSISWASSHYGWPNATRLIPAMRTVLHERTGPLLADDRGNVLDYYLPDELSHRQVIGTWFFAFNDPKSGRHLIGRSAYAAAIKEGYFSVVMLEFWDTVSMDRVIQKDIKRYQGYRLISDFPYPATGIHGNYMIWVRR